MLNRQLRSYEDGELLRVDLNIYLISKLFCLINRTFLGIVMNVF